MELAHKTQNTATWQGLRSAQEVHEEVSQSIARLVLSGLCFMTIILISWLSPSDVTLPAALIGIYTVASVIWWQVVSRRPGLVMWRRYAVIVGDLGVTSIVLIQVGSVGAIFVVLYLWVVIGNGMRYGRVWLHRATAFSLASFACVAVMSPFWRFNWAVSLGSFISLIALPALYSVQLKRHDALALQLDDLLAQNHYAATHDFLTDSGNRASFISALETEISRHNEGSTGAVGLTVLIIDLNGFKAINDEHGHGMGDHVLQVTAERFRSACRPADYFARLGGDEFGAVLPGLTEAADVAEAVRRFVDRASEPIIFDGLVLSVSASAGVATCPVDATTAGDLIRLADAAMYEDKRSTKGALTAANQ
jgi:diguanylate cyclase (GGDEF)-like protein